MRLSGVDPSMRLYCGGLLARACVYIGVCWEHAGVAGPTCVYIGVCWPEHASISGSAASISGSAGPSMRLYRGLLARACVYIGVRPEHRLYRGLAGPEHASISGSAGPSMPGACVYIGVCCVNSAVYFDRLTRCVYIGVGVCWPCQATDRTGPPATDKTGPPRRVRDVHGVSFGWFPVVRLAEEKRMLEEPRKRPLRRFSRSR